VVNEPQLELVVAAFSLSLTAIGNTRLNEVRLYFPKIEEGDNGDAVLIDRLVLRHDGLEEQKREDELDVKREAESLCR